MTGSKLSEKQMSTLLDHLSDVVLIVDRQGLYRYVSSGREELLYDKPENIVGKHSLELFDLESAEKFQEVVETVLKTQEMAIIEYPLMTGGTQRWFQGTASLLKGWEGDEEEYVLVVANDITKRKHLEIKIEQERLEAEKAREAAQQRLLEQQALAVRSDRFRSLGEMAAGLAHELNQPLSGIRVFAESIYLSLEQGWEVGNEEVIYKTKRIVEQADRMSKLVEHIHHFTREAEKPISMPVDVRAVLESALMLVRARFRAHAIDVKTEIESESPIVSANPYSLEEVILGLLSNAYDALDFGDDGDFTEIKEIAVRVFDSDEPFPSVVVEVRDNGIGMTREEQQRVFDPFYTTKSPDKGVGLGLSVAKKIVDDLKGDIQISSEPSEGTVVRIALPQVHGSDGV